MAMGKQEQPAKRPRGRPAADAQPVANREEFLDVALDVFAELGFEGASLRELTRRLNVSHGLIIARFGSKLQLWKAAVDHGVRRLEEQVEQAQLAAPSTTDHAQRLKNIYVAFLLALSREPAILRMMNLEGQRNSERLRYIVDSYMSASSFQGAKALLDGQQDGVFRSVSPAVMLFLVAYGGGAVFSQGALALLLGINISEDPESLKKCAEEIAEIMINGISIQHVGIAEAGENHSTIDIP